MTGTPGLLDRDNFQCILLPSALPECLDPEFSKDEFNWLFCPRPQVLGFRSACMLVAVAVDVLPHFSSWLCFGAGRRGSSGKKAPGLPTQNAFWVEG